MKKQHIIILLGFIAVLLFILPFFFEKETNENIISGINLVSGFSSLLTLIIALLLFNKYGIETSLIERQTKLVFELLESLNKSNVRILGNKEFMRFNPAKPYLEIYENYYDRKLSFSSKYIQGLQHIWRFSGNVFLPKEIANKLKAVQVNFIVGSQETLGDDELKVSVRFNSEQTEVVGKGNDEEMTLLDFVNNWNELIDEIRNWISNNSSIKSDLNLE